MNERIANSEGELAQKARKISEFDWMVMKSRMNDNWQPIEWWSEQRINLISISWSSIPLYFNLAEWTEMKSLIAACGFIARAKTAMNAAIKQAQENI